VVKYDSPAGKLAAYVSVSPLDGKKHPAVIWLFGGFSNGIGETAWEKGPSCISLFEPLETSAPRT
jgi:hypothetical protein